ncbi:MAG: hypothetical protein E7554_08515 [Ruminococcaceae bacterium]|nr:hypothetical protein [Oscillospiraceae bacterium]
MSGYDDRNPKDFCDMPVRVTVDYINHDRDRYEKIAMSDTERLFLDCDSGEIEYTCVDNVFERRTTHKVTDVHSALVLMEMFYTCVIQFLKFEKEKLDRNEFSKTYRIDAEMRDGSRMTYTGSYNRDGLPDRWGEILYFVENTLFAEREQNMFDRRVYGIPAGAHNGNYIYCGVRFEGGSRVYHYIADRDVYSVGDIVMVPVGSYGHISEAEIVSVEYFGEKDVPWPIELTKHIICCQEDWDDDSDFDDDLCL